MGQFFYLDKNTKLYAEGPIPEPVRYAMESFRRDMENTLSESSGGRDTKILLVQDEHEAIPPEGYIITFPDFHTMRVAASRPLGHAYGLYFISERFLGVSPFWYWNDQAFTRRKEAAIPPGTYRSPEYRVRWRGWFVNDEVLIDRWREEPDNRESWRMVFEALLRCGGNMVIPGTDENSRKNRRAASEMGLRITHHHAEPLGAEMFARAFPGKLPSYTENPALFHQLWERAIEEQKEYNVIWGLGFRGQGDRPFWEDDPNAASPGQRGALISGVIARQYALLQRHTENPVCCVNLYGEIMELYRQGHLALPDGVIRIWADNGYGRMVSRRQGNHNPRVDALPSPGDKGPHGLYYHCSFHDLQASNHLTMSPNPSEFLSGELSAAFAAGADEFLIVNCGSLKPHLYPLDLIRVLWRDGKTDAPAHRMEYSERYYGSHAGQVSRCLEQFTRATIQYGPHDDERAGEQLCHHPVRELLCAWISGNTGKSLDSLRWLTGDVGYANQVNCLSSLCKEAAPGWESLHGRCMRVLGETRGPDKALFADSLMLQVKLHLSGLRGAISFCESYAAYAAGDAAGAFLAAARAETEYSKGVAALDAASHGKWRGFYDNDCLTNVRLTRDCLGALTGFLRVVGDGPSFHKWEKEYLSTKADRNVELLSCTGLHLSDSQMYVVLEQKLDKKA